jgi:hypothetical protein
VEEFGEPVPGNYFHYTALAFLRTRRLCTLFVSTTGHSTAGQPSRTQGLPRPTLRGCRGSLTQRPTVSSGMTPL